MTSITTFCFRIGVVSCFPENKHTGACLRTVVSLLDGLYFTNLERDIITNQHEVNRFLARSWRNNLLIFWWDKKVSNICYSVIIVFFSISLTFHCLTDCFQEVVRKNGSLLASDCSWANIAPVQQEKGKKSKISNFPIQVKVFHMDQRLYWRNRPFRSFPKNFEVKRRFSHSAGSKNCRFAADGFFPRGTMPGRSVRTILLNNQITWKTPIRSQTGKLFGEIRLLLCEQFEKTSGLTASVCN